MSMTKREKILIAIVLVLAVFVAYYMFLLKPCLDNLDKLKKENDNKTTSVSTNEQMQLNVALIDKGIDDDKAKITVYGKSVLTDFDQPPVLVYLSEVIAQYGSKMTISFEVVKGASITRINKATVTMNVTYEGLKKIIKALDEGEYYLKITGITASLKTPEEAQTPTDGDTTQTAPPAEQTTAAPETSPSESTAPETIADDTIDVSMTLEFYNSEGEIPPDKEYSFTEGSSYGGDLFY